MARIRVKAPQSGAQIVDSSPRSSERWRSFLTRRRLLREIVRSVSNSVTLRGNGAKSPTTNALSGSLELDRRNGESALGRCRRCGGLVLMSSLDQEVDAQASRISSEVLDVSGGR